MKILYTITKSEMGGAQVHVAQLVESMKNSNHQVAVMAAPGGWLEYELTKIGVRFYSNPYFANSFNPFNLFRSLSLIKKSVNEWRPDLVHAHSSFAGALTRLALRGRIPTIFTAHSWAFTDGVKPFRKVIAILAEKFVSRWTKKIICVSDYDKELALRFRICKKDKLIRIYNGVRPSDGLNTDKENTIISVGRLTYQKDFLLLIESFYQSKIDFILKIVGSGPDEEIIKNKIKDLNLETKVILTGGLSPEEVRREMKKAKVFILISKYEGLPMTILEAMSEALPVIASHVGGISEELAEDSGLLVENNVADIVSKINLIKDEDFRIKISQKSLGRYKDIFTLEKFIENTKELYDEVVPI